MGPGGALVLVLVGIVVAFWAGMRWRHNTLAWQTHRVQAGRARDARAAKWTAFWAVVVSSAILVFYMFIVTTRALGNDAPGPHPSPRPTNHPTSVNAPTTHR